MHHGIFDRPAIPLPRIAPGPLGKKFFVGSRRHRMQRTIGVQREATFVGRAAETEIDTLQFAGGIDDRVSHWNGAIRLVVGEPGGTGNEWQRDELPNEDDAVTRRSADGAPHIKAKIHFLEVAMKESRHAEHVGVEEENPHQADKMTSFFLIDLGALGYEWFDPRRIDLEVQHGQIPPLGGQECPRHCSRPPAFTMTSVRQLQLRALPVRGRAREFGEATLRSSAASNLAGGYRHCTTYGLPVG